jgi:flavin reductase (DIM6/NTAB) family NADH-FMN oxidoreductase RutF
VIDREVKRSLGQMIKGVQVVGATDGERSRLYCSHWICQVSFEEPILMASISPKHDTYPLIRDTGRWSVSLLAADQVAEGQYFSYPGRKFQYLASEYVTEWDGLPVVPDAIAWLACETFAVEEAPGGVELDHHLFFGRVVAVEPGRLSEPPLLYSSRLGWRATGGKAREPGTSIRDALLARLDDPDSPDSST